MTDPTLRRELGKVSLRYARLGKRLMLAGCWASAAFAGLLLIALMTGALGGGWTLAGLFLCVGLAVSAVVIFRRADRRFRDPKWLARRIEKRFPDLDARLLAATEQRAAPRFGYLQQAVVEESLAHAHTHGWGRVVSPRWLQAAAALHGVALGAMVVVLAAVAMHVWALSTEPRPPANLAAVTAGAGTPEVRVEPEDTVVERNTSLIVLARFGDRSSPAGGLPRDVTLLVRDAKTGAVTSAATAPATAPAARELAMSKSMDDPVFAGRVPAVSADLTYAVRYGDRQTRWFKVGVFDHPELDRADAKLVSPAYTKLPEKTIEDVRSVTAVEGTKATLTFRLNKPVTSATLVPAAEKMPATGPAESSAAPPPVELKVDPADPTVYTAAVDLKRSASYALKLVDDAGRQSKRPATLAINVVPNRPADLKPEFPAKDVDASPIEELGVRATVWDDFGVRRVGVTYSLAGQPPTDVVLAENVPAKDRRQVAHTVALEKLGAKPDQLLTYHFWAEDDAADGSVRRTMGDLYFAEIRPFEEIFRQGQQSAADDEQQQQQNPQANQNARQAEEAAEGQKQIIAATWKVIRREASTTPSEAFAADAKLLAESQAAAREKAAGMAEKLSDPRSQAFLTNVLKFMDDAAGSLTQAAEAKSVAKLTVALAPEQAAYQELLKLRAHEHEVVRGKRQQSGKQSASSSSARQQKQLDQLKLAEEQNRYEQQRSAAAPKPPADAQAQQETRQVLSRLRELAQRQDDLNKQMKETQSALAEAKEQAKKEEAQRQLARLRDRQRDLLRDADELQDRMQQPENQERMADARQQLEKARDDVSKASESLEKGQVSDASAAGAKAGEKLTDLREQFRRSAAGQFSDSVNQLRQSARELDDRQKQLSQQLAEADGKSPAGRPRQDQPVRSPPSGAARNTDKSADGASASPTQGRDATAATPAGGEKPGEAVESGDRPPTGGRGLTAGAGERWPPSLRGQGVDRERVAEALKNQRDKLENLLDEMRKTVESSEAAEPLLSKQLYDTVRQARQQQTGEALDAARRMVDRGFAEEARRAGDEAGQGIAKLREGVEKAATGVLGDETESLRLARAELDSLAQQLDREMARNGASGAERQDGKNGGRTGTDQDAGASTRPAMAGRNAARQGATRPTDPEVAEAVPQASSRANRAGATRPSDAARKETAQAGGRKGDGQPDPRQADGRDGRSPGERPDAGGERASGRGAGGERQSEAGQPGEEGRPAGEQPGEGQLSARGREPGQGGPSGRSQQSAQDGQPGTASGSGQSGEPGQPGTPADASASADQAGRPGQSGNQPGGQRGGSGLRGGSGNRPSAGGRSGGGEGRGGPETAGPIAGEGFRQWSDRLRDVEEMVGDPNLRAEAARVRERAREMRTEAELHSKPPNWDAVRTTIGQPLAGLRQAVTDELRRREGGQDLVPIDRDPVPPAYAEQVRRYYERLGSGK